ncbi:M48 family metalloprotease [Thiothrix lacustris]|uniref:M48 family metalloprotease n=1 Tax=Thiothrix lacustris TaxID=525917 RepID=A0ABY9MLC6_9GAMM|nr:M48 family metalloprotease [Thiothrix lacustris]WML89474.1 M48 family metalloprotease [Thiothrix lacustris]
MDWQPWQGTEREDFFNAVARHRRTAWRITLVCGVAYAVLALVMSLLLAPLLFGVAGLVLDILSLLFPTPDLLAYAGKLLSPIVDDPRAVPLADLLSFILLASAPGLLLMLMVAWVVSRAIRHSALFDTTQQLGRPPDPLSLVERQFANTLEEMAVAALIPAPKVVIIEGGANAAASGMDAQQATVVIGQSLLALINRAQMQGIAAHLIAAIADNDMKIGMRTASVLGVFALLTRLSVSLLDKDSFAASRHLMRALCVPTAASQAFVLAQLSDPFIDASLPAASQYDNKLGWREWLLMPLMGPVWFSGFLGGFVSTLILSPGIAWAWQQRKYMADATAVRLTREPDGLSTALSVLSHANTSLLSGAWASHLCVVAPQQTTGMIISVFPAVERRLAALVRMGASHQPMATPSSVSPLWIRLLVGGLLVVMAGLVAVLLPLLVIASTMLTMLFTIMPIAILHALLR